MIRGLGFGAFLFVDCGAGQVFGDAGGEQCVVDAQAGVSVPGAGLVVPECVEGVVRVQGADGFGEAEPEQGVEGAAGFGADQSVGFGDGTGCEVGIGGADIIVAGEDEICVGIQHGLGVGAQGGHPFEFISVADITV